MNDPDDSREVARRLARGVHFLDTPFVLQTYAASDSITSLRPGTGGMVWSQPYRPDAFDPAWLTPASVAMARTIDEHRSFDLLPDLAEALEEAGCRVLAVFDHCREPGEHARGCWVVDSVLGKS